MLAADALGSEPFLGIFDLTSTPDNPVHCFLSLPLPGSAAEVEELSISYDSSRPSWKCPFSSNCEDHLFTITYKTYAWSSDTLSTYLLLLPWSTLRRLVTREKLSRHGPSIPWSEWGPSNTRFIALNHGISNVWVCHTYGTKCAMASGPIQGHYYSSVKLYDFNQLSAKHDIQSASNLTNVLVDSTTLDSSDKTFVTPISTDLACRYVEVDLPGSVDGKYEAILMSEDSLIAVSVSTRFINE